MKSNKSVIYLLSGMPHAPYLVVSLHSLRRFYKGNVSIYAWPESYPIAKRIAAYLGADCYEREPKYRRKDGVRGNSQFLDKIDLMQSIPFDVGLYIDADTSIHGFVDPLFRMLEGHEFVATQFNNWFVNSKMIRGRVSKLLGVEGVNQKSVNRVLEMQAPSVNGGVFVCRPDTEILEKWYNWTLLIKKEFIADECALHSLIGEYENSGKFVIAMGGKYNCAPKFQPDYLKDEDVVIYHYHGDSCVRPNKSPKGVWLWWKQYMKCLENNIGGIADWKDECRNKYIWKLENRSENICLYCGYNMPIDGHSKKCPEFNCH